jgi:hypothetical protein
MRRVLLAITLIIIFVSGLTVYIKYVRTSPAVSNDSGQLNSAENSKQPSISFNTPNTQAVLNSDASTEQKYGELITYGAMQESAREYQKAYDYYIAASSLKDISAVQKNGAFFSAYQAALLLDDTEKAAAAKDAIPIQDFEVLNGSSYQEGERGE